MATWLNNGQYFLKKYTLFPYQYKVKRRFFMAKVVCCNVYNASSMYDITETHELKDCLTEDLKL